MRFGFHTSVAGRVYLAVDRAVERHCETMQIFSSSPRSWQWQELNPADIQEFIARRARAQIFPLVLHAPYLVNLGSPFKDIYNKSAKTLKEGVRRGEKLQADYLVFHVGSFKGGDRSEGLKSVARSVRTLFRSNFSLQLLLENTSGAGHSLGSTFEELRFILDEVGEDKRVGVCFDTAHTFAAGYDLSNQDAVAKTMALFDKIVGLEKLKLIHANDSKKPCGARSDRHEHIGKGYIGLDGFKAIVNHPKLKDLPCILETPRMAVGEDMRNLETIRGLVEKPR